MDESLEIAPLILIAPSTEKRGSEFYDYSVTLSDAYCRAILAAGGIPWILPCAPTARFLAECVRRADGTLLTGGDDIQPSLYADKVPEKLRRTVTDVDPARDLLETLLIKETLEQKKPLLGICRGHQILNIALGGDLIVDIASQVPEALNHRELEKKDKIVHQASILPGSLLAEIFAKEKIGVNSTHHQAVGKIAKGLRATALSEDGIVEALEWVPEMAQTSPWLLSVQFHPERLIWAWPAFLEIFRGFTKACALSRRGGL